MTADALLVACAETAEALGAGLFFDIDRATKLTEVETLKFWFYFPAGILAGSSKFTRESFRFAEHGAAPAGSRVWDWAA